MFQPNPTPNVPKQSTLRLNIGLLALATAASLARADLPPTVLQALKAAQIPATSRSMPAPLWLPTMPAAR